MKNHFQAEAHLRKNRLCVLLILLLLNPAIAAAQEGAKTGAVRGKVIEKFSGEPITGVKVSVAETTLGATSDSAGNFTIGDVPTGNRSVYAALEGFKSQSLRITVAQGDTGFIRVSMQTDAFAVSEIVIEADREYSAASSRELRAVDFDLRPRQSAQDLLRLVPGLFIAQHAGGGKAEQIFLRGFDIDHGTDINISVDGLPVNMVSHGHGQGYADAHFIIPETIERIDIQKGPYFAERGDFATAGAVSFKTKDALDYNLVSLEGGGYGFGHGVALLQLPIENDQTSAYIATEFLHNDSFFESKQDFNRYNLFGKLTTRLSNEATLGLSFSGFGSSWNASGQIPERAIASGEITRFGSIDALEGGTTQRENLILSYNSSLKSNASLQTSLYYTHYRFRLFSNFTFFKDDPVNGDMIEQNDLRSIFGFRGQYQIRGAISTIRTATSIGTEFRTDEINVELYRAPNRVRTTSTALAIVHEKSTGIFVKEELIFSPRFRMEFGLRGDYFIFDVEDRLKKDSVDQSRYVQQTLLSPKFNAIYSPFQRLDIFLDAGTGFHSNDARGVARDNNLPVLPRAFGGEFGLRIQPVDQLVISAAAWILDLENELVYVGDEGVTEVSGPTRRIGLDLDARYQVLAWLYADLDVNLSRGRYKDAAEGEDFIALAPTFTSVGGLTARYPNGLEGSLRYRHLSAAPAIEDNSVQTRGYTVFDLTLGFRTPAYKIGLTVENLFNTNWNEAQFETESQLRNETAPVQELHFTPGTPVNVKGSISYFF
ncbi:MAG: TonB-dependent receptor [Rhizobacter sp.]|nr:TonB-dependent receptor [Chlorobiales bacterium]